MARQCLLSGFKSCQRCALLGFQLTAAHDFQLQSTVASSECASHRMMSLRVGTRRRSPLEKWRKSQSSSSWQKPVTNLLFLTACEIVWACKPVANNSL